MFLGSALGPTRAKLWPDHVVKPFLQWVPQEDLLEFPAQIELAYAILFLGGEAILFLATSLLATSQDGFEV